LQNLRPQETTISALMEKVEGWKKETEGAPHIKPLFAAYRHHWQAFKDLKTFFGPNSAPIDAETIRPLLSAKSSGQEDSDELIVRMFESFLRSSEHPELFFTLTMDKKFRAGDVQKTITGCERSYGLHLEVPQEDMTAQQLLDRWTNWASVASCKDPAESCTYKKAGVTYTIEEERCQLGELPEILMIHLVRHKYDKEAKEQSKLEKRVEFTEELTIQGQQYRFRAAARHIGSSAKSGHYTALVRRGEKLWYCNDTIVTEATEEQKAKVLNEGYIYFFEKIKIDGAVAE